MPHTIGGVNLPLTASDGQEPRAKGSPGAPWIGTLVEGLRITIERQCGAAWNSLCATDPIIRAAIPRDPYKYHFAARELPGLFLWADATVPVQVERLSAGVTTRGVALNLMWLPPPHQQQTADKWSNFWVAIDGAIDLAINTAYSPWTNENAWGLTLVDQANLARLQMGQGGETRVQPEGVESPYMGYQWRLTAHQTVTYDPTVNTAAEPAPIVPNKLQANINGGDDGFWILQKLEPAELWE